MIFVTVGSTDFDALVREVDRLSAPGGPFAGQEVIMQIGEGQYVPQHAESFRFAPSLQPYFDRADLVIAHGGLGTAVEAIGCGRRLLAVANPDRYDNHQEDLMGALARQGCLLWCPDPRHIEEQASIALSFVPELYVCPPSSIHIRIADYLAHAGRRPR
jgi:UDP-N-acetylglucosamine transferase subunit ALG13